MNKTISIKITACSVIKFIIAFMPFYFMLYFRIVDNFEKLNFINEYKYFTYADYQNLLKHSILVNIVLLLFILIICLFFKIYQVAGIEK
jgi:hypothetical protein